MPNLSSLFTKFLFRETLTTEEKTAIRGDIGVPAPPSTESVLALLEEAAVEVDYLKVADHEGATIPDNVYSRKGRTPYFGNFPISDGISSSFDGNITPTIALTKITLASIPLDASRVTLGRLFLKYTIFMTVGVATPDRFALWIDFDGATDPATGGLLLLLRNTGDNMFIFDGSVSINPGTTPGKVGIVIDAACPSNINATGAKMMAPFDEYADLTYGFPEGSADEGVANHVNLYLIDITGGASTTVSAQGTFTVKD